MKRLAKGHWRLRLLASKKLGLKKIMDTEDYFELRLSMVYSFGRMLYNYGPEIEYKHMFEHEIDCRARC